MKPVALFVTFVAAIAVARVVPTARQLVGSWTFAAMDSTQTLTFERDHTFFSSTRSGGERFVDSSGTWEVRGGALRRTITYIAAADQKVPRMLTDIITRIDEKALVFASGLTYTREKRASKPQFAIYVVKGTPNDTAAHVAGPDLAHAVVEDPPLLTQDDVVLYEWATHSITLTPAGEKKLFEYKGPDNERTGSLALRGREFLVTVDKQRCYGGAFWWRIYSSGYMHPVIDVYERSQTIQIQRAFPSLPPDQSSSPDPRFDPRVEYALRAAGKIRNAAPSSTPF